MFKFIKLIFPHYIMQSPRRFISKTPKQLQTGISFPAEITIFLEALKIKDMPKQASFKEHYEIFATIG
jgi:hypothetical protein